MSDDLALLQKWQAGDAAAGNALFTKYYPAVYRFFRGKLESDAADLVQETFLACLHAQGSVRDPAAFRSFLFGVARNKLFAYWRKRAVRGTAIDFDEMSIAALSTSLGSRVVRQEDRARLLEALRELPLEQQLLLELFYWEGLDGEQLASVFAIEPPTTRSRLARARQALRDRLKRDPAAPTFGEDRDLDAWARQLSVQLEAGEEIRDHSGG